MAKSFVFSPRAAIDAVQAANFAEMMDLVAARHPYYRALMAKHGLQRGDFRTPDDLAKLPVTTKASYMAEPQSFRLESAGLPEEMRIVWDIMYTTGSTSGQPTPFVSTTFDFYNILATNRSMLKIRRVGPGDVIANLFPLTKYPHGAFIRALHAASVANIPVVSTLPGNPSPYFEQGNSLDGVVAIIARSKATILWGVPSYTRRVLQRAEELGADFAAIRMVFVTGEGLSEAAREDLVTRLTRLGAREPVISGSYGITEMQGGMVECRPGAGYHNPAPDQFLVEIVDPDTHRPLPDGEPGLILLTHLKRRGTVLLRYALGDITIRERAPCPYCGAETDRLVAMPRRHDGLVKIKGMLVNPEIIVDELSKLAAIADFQIVIAKEDPADDLSMDRLSLKVAAAGADDGLRRLIIEGVKAAVGVTPVVEFVPPASLVDQSESWKLKQVVDLRRR